MLGVIVFIYLFILKMIISYPIVIIVVLNAKVFERTRRFFFFFLNKVLNVILAFEFGMRKKKVGVMEISDNC